MKYKLILINEQGMTTSQGEFENISSALRYKSKIKKHIKGQLVVQPINPWEKWYVNKINNNSRKTLWWYRNKY